MRIAESVCGSSPSDFIRLKVSRQEMPASTRIFVQALATIAQLPRLPLASIETHTPMLAAYASALWIRELLFGYPIPTCRSSASETEKPEVLFTFPRASYPSPFAESPRHTPQQFREEM